MTSTTGADKPQGAKTATGGRLVGFDGMRGVLALTVILVHALGALAPITLHNSRIDLLGQVIVVFFAMSGFLIYWPFAARIIEQRQAPSLRSYYLARLFRVYPAYIVIFLFSSLVLGAVFVRNAMESMRPFTDAGTGRITDIGELLLHISLLQNYLPSGLQTGINSSWTLTAEITFYALLPLLAWWGARLAAGRVRNRYLAAAMPGIILFGFGLVMRAVGAILFALSDLSVLDAEWGATWLGVFSRSFFVWADNFGAGMIAVVLFLAVRNGALTHLGRWRIRTVAIWVMVASLLVAGVAVVFLTRFVSSFVAIAAGAFFLALLLPTARDRITALAVALDVKPLHYIGLISLSVYLWHYPVLIVMIRLGWPAHDTPIGALATFVGVSLVSIALGSVTYWLIERPAQLFAARLRAPKKAEAVPSGGTGDSQAS